MTYPNKERKQAKEEADRKIRLMQARIYKNSDSFEEYKIKCAACALRRKFMFFGLVDPFWFHYKANDTGFTRLIALFDVPVMLFLCVAFAGICRIFGWPEHVSVIGSASIGALVWPICHTVICRMSNAVSGLICDAELEERGIIP